MRRSDFERRTRGYGSNEEPHDDDDQLPWGALIMTLLFLVMLSALWIQLYLDLMTRGSIPQL